ncbi:putative amino acid transporter [Dactylonectria macrodidyma]|uniref:Amino acid transporter n=1 Tax=Dactylonectria macrodidyma TaxID=307937 RepID=A0A9P9F730_9HYPO|nr:putative amino acid transporter [Dactylonectria macrodidyma]
MPLQTMSEICPTKKDPERMDPVLSEKSEVIEGEILQGNTFAHDAVFGNLDKDGPNYRDVGWLGTVVLMVKTQIGLGVLAIPSVFDTVGLIPGVILLCVIGSMTTWSNYMVGVFKLRHREVYGIDDAGELMFGRIGREVLGAASSLYLIFIAGSGMLSISIGLNAISIHAACTAAFVAVAAIAGFIFASIRTLGRISWIAWVGVACILTSILTVTISVGVQVRPSSAPREGDWKSDYKLFNSPSFTAAMAAISSLVFAYGGTPAFFPLVAEMRDPTQYTRALIVCQSVVTVTYVAIGIVVYYYCGSYVASPALGSAGPLLKRVCYGIALPGLVATVVLYLHLPSKYIFIRILRGSKHLASNSVIHWATWLGCTFGVTMVAYVIASGIPIFGSLTSLIGALLGTFVCFQPMACMWLYDNWAKGKDARSLKWILMVCWCAFVIISGSFLMVSGTYSAVVGIIDSYKASRGTSAWSCADNSNSV